MELQRSFSGPHTLIFFFTKVGHSIFLQIQHPNNLLLKCLLNVSPLSTQGGGVLPGSPIFFSRSAHALNISAGITQIDFLLHPLIKEAKKGTNSPISFPMNRNGPILLKIWSDNCIAILT